ncbi:MAG: hypothetical protein KBF99_03625 [Leptospiraceae bacterium]|jgi:uncharacterized protein YxeA|nr:hypothetical protein [Leptospiraceae bacterium]MBK7057415.1 hypothetical protein [Leptospiraceae bacterium]MBK9503611.1 hypothetical protein [Leptospiraceae bacterium]MBP9162242.1 hypothetical protein [Leptospiraceae bacterium]
MKTKLIILPLCIFFLNASLFAFNRIAEEESIPMQKTKENKKKSEADNKDVKDTDSDTNDKSLKDKIKEKIKEKTKKDKKEGGRFGDKRF